MTPTLALDAITKRFGKETALDGVRFDVPDGALVVLLGAAGAGKTTTLRIIAGLTVPDGGRVLLDGRDAADLPPRSRDVAMIFDNLALYPHKDGFENIAHPLRTRGVPRAEIEAKVMEVAATLRIAHVLRRLPKTMSGGERQRIALGRALVRDPRLFLLDEPLSSLDAMLRVELRAELKRLQQEEGYAFLLATPDFDEALAIADTIVMLVKGTVRQVATPAELYDRPADRDVARFVGAPAINLVAGAFDAGAVRLIGGTFAAPPPLATRLAAAPSFEVGLRPEHVALAAPDADGAPARVTDLERLGIRTALTLDTDAETIRVTLPAADATRHRVGDTVRLQPAIERLHAFDRASGRRI